MSSTKTLSRIIQLQALVYNKQKDFTKGIRNKMPPGELKALNEEIKKIHQELLTLRSAASFQESGGNSQEHARGRAAIKLVFVDDDDDDRALIQEGLSTLLIDHFRVLDSGAELLAFLHNLDTAEFPEAIILDLNMPQMSGLDVLRILKSREAYQAIPVYMLTTASDPGIRQHCLAEGADDYFTKPNTLVELFALLNRIHSTVMN